MTAARAGRVSFYGWAGAGGNLMIVSHEAGYTTVYAHLNRAARRVGDRVDAGDTIAYEGSTGFSTGPHVHFEVKRYGTKQFVPGAVGAHFVRGRPLAHDYAGIGATPSGGGGGGGGGSSAPTAWRVTADTLNVRSGPSTSNPVLGVLRTGQVHVAEGSSGAWRKIWFDGRLAWAHGGWLARARGVTERTVTADALNVRAGPGTRTDVVKVIQRGERYVQARKQGDWIEVWFDGHKRWVHGDYTRAVAR